jgi:hypothetical protein
VKVPERLEDALAGAGKTLISVLLIKEKAEELAKSGEGKSKVTVFLAPKVDLVLQVPPSLPPLNHTSEI